MKYLAFLLSFLIAIAVFATVATAIHPIEITKTADKDIVDFGETLTYTINVTNTGSSAIGDLIVKDLLPEGVIFLSASPTESYVEMAGGKIKRVFWEFDTLNAGQTITINLTVRNNMTEGTLVNNAWVRVEPEEKGPVTVYTKVQTISIPEFPTIAIPIVLSLLSFGLIFLRKFR